MLKNLVNYARQNKDELNDEEFHRNLIRREAVIGGQVFGPVPRGHRREFFCLDKHSWIWYEEWIDKNGVKRDMSTRYEVRPSGLVKVQNGLYKPVSKAEARRFKIATDRYFKRVEEQLYAGLA